METLDTLSLLGKINREQPEILLGTLELLLDVSPGMIFVKDRNLAYVAATQSFAEMLGKESVPEILGKTDFDLLGDKAFSRHFSTNDKKLLLNKQNLINYVEHITDKDGKPRHMAISKYLITNKQGEAIGILGICQDITRDTSKETASKRPPFFF